MVRKIQGLFLSSRWPAGTAVCAGHCWS